LKVKGKDETQALSFSLSAFGHQGKTSEGLSRSMKSSTFRADQFNEDPIFQGDRMNDA
jgi:hypothetical protein